MSAPWVTSHAHQRAQERLGLQGMVVVALAGWCMELGLDRADVGGKLGRYVDELARRDHRRGTQLRIYGRHIWVFRDSCLITVMTLPRRYHALAIKYWRRRHG